MTRKLFIETAKIIAAIADAQTRINLANEFATLFKRENPAFDRNRFLTACNAN